MKKPYKGRLAAAMFLLANLFIAPAYADWPEKPVTIVVPFGAGSIQERGCAGHLSGGFLEISAVSSRE